MGTELVSIVVKQGLRSLTTCSLSTRGLEIRPQFEVDDEELLHCGVRHKEPSNGITYLHEVVVLYNLIVWSHPIKRALKPLPSIWIECSFSTLMTIRVFGDLSYLSSLISTGVPMSVILSTGTE